MNFCKLILLTSLVILSPYLSAAEVTRLTPENWDEYVPAGKEIDAIYGDYVIRNDVLTAIIAQPTPTRNANLTIREVGGCVLDLTRHDSDNDQLGCFYPTGQRFAFTNPESVKIAVSRGEGATLHITSQKESNGTSARLIYSLSKGDQSLRVITEFLNDSDETVTIKLQDSIRADSPFQLGGSKNTFWANDEWFKQAYGVWTPEREIKRTGGGGRVLDYSANGGDSSFELQAKQRGAFQRELIPAGSLLELKTIFNTLSKVTQSPVTLGVHDAAGPISHAQIIVKQGDQTLGNARTSAEGKCKFALPSGTYSVTCNAAGRPSREVEFKVEGATDQSIELKEAGYVSGRITDGNGRPIYAKLSFHGLKDTATPNFAPKQNGVFADNLYYATNGRVHHPLLPGSYQVIISHGPEFNADVQNIVIREGETTDLNSALDHVIDSRGWISADFHTHSSPSGDNTTDQTGRILTLLAENIEYSPATEHQRVDSFTPILKKLKAEHLMGTVAGMELTGRELPVNHQNSFPLIHKPRTQNGGGPTIEDNPVAQIKKLKGWDNNSDKIVQEDHPTLLQIWRDKDKDNTFDGGFREMLNYMDTMEVHPPQSIFQVPEELLPTAQSRSPVMFYWMQLINKGYRITGVVNSDCHYNDHDSGFLRNYVLSPTDKPGRIKTEDIVAACRQGNIVMTNGPFLHVEVVGSKKATALPGDDLECPGGKVSVRISVQCPNWFDINRVQIFLNGRMNEELNFTRRDNAGMFPATSVTRFDETVDITLKEDTHIIVATIGEGLKIGPVQGERRGALEPAAVANPVFVDVDGNGFQYNNDNLGIDLDAK